jgi:hypothetical protein
MKRSVIVLSLILLSGINNLFPQSSADVSVYLITCGPGTETYSIYGHCAVRIVIPDKGSDLVYNWGVFDFSTPNFVWKFAKGRLDYMLGVYPYNRFLQEYFLEQRWVKSQKINLEPVEINTLLGLISENLKPENIKYRYDFFFDNCATRIRDILEKSLGNKLIYPPQARKDMLTFRDKIGQYESPYPWLKMGTDLLIGTPAEKKVSFRDKMFLPVDMQEGLSEVVINRNGKMVPLLQNPETLVDFESPSVKQNFFTSPIFVFSLLLILIILFFALVRNRRAIKFVDVVIFTVFSVLALIMIFFNFFTDHQELRRNLNIIWLSPFILPCLAAVIMNKNREVWFRIVFILCILSFVIQLVIPHAFNNAFIPLLLILMLRCSARAGFSWNPLSVSSF